MSFLFEAEEKIPFKDICKVLLNGKYYDKDSDSVDIDTDSAAWNELYLAAKTFDKKLLLGRKILQFVDYKDPTSNTFREKSDVYFKNLTDNVGAFVVDEDKVKELNIRDFQMTSDPKEAQLVTTDGAKAIIKVIKAINAGRKDNRKSWLAAQVVDLPNNLDSIDRSIQTATSADLREVILSTYLDKRQIKVDSQTFNFLARQMCPKFKAPLKGNAFIEYAKKFNDVWNEELPFTAFQAALQLVKARILTQSLLIADNKKSALLYNMHAIKTWGSELANMINTYTKLLVTFKANSDFVNELFFKLDNDDSLPEGAIKLLQDKLDTLTDEDLKTVLKYGKLNPKTAMVRSAQTIKDNAQTSVKISNDEAYIQAVVDSEPISKKAFFDNEKNSYIVTLRLTDELKGKELKFAHKTAQMETSRISFEATPHLEIDATAKTFITPQDKFIKINDNVNTKLNIQLAFVFNKDFILKQVISKKGVAKK